MKAKLYKASKDPRCRVVFETLQSRIRNYKWDLETSLTKPRRVIAEDYIGKIFYETIKVLSIKDENPTSKTIVKQQANNTRPRRKNSEFENLSNKYNLLFEENKTLKKKLLKYEET